MRWARIFLLLALLCRAVGLQPEENHSALLVPLSHVLQFLQVAAQRNGSRLGEENHSAALEPLSFLHRHVQGATYTNSSQLKEAINFLSRHAAVERAATPRQLLAAAARLRQRREALGDIPQALVEQEATLESTLVEKNQQKTTAHTHSNAKTVASAQKVVQEKKGAATIRKVESALKPVRSDPLAKPAGDVSPVLTNDDSPAKALNPSATASNHGPQLKTLLANSPSSICGGEDIWKKITQSSSVRGVQNIHWSKINAIADEYIANQKAQVEALELEIEMLTNRINQKQSAARPEASRQQLRDLITGSVSSGFGSVDAAQRTKCGTPGIQPQAPRHAFQTSRKKFAVDAQALFLGRLDFDGSTFADICGELLYCPDNGQECHCRQLCQQLRDIAQDVSDSVLEEGGLSAEEQCAALCKAQGYCCNDPSIGMNQMLSCSQACVIRARGLNKLSCLGHCARSDSSGCIVSAGGSNYNLCGSCSDITDVPQCKSGVASAEACRVGCGLEPTNGAQPIEDELVKQTINALEQPIEQPDELEEESSKAELVVVTVGASDSGAKCVVADGVVCGPSAGMKERRVNQDFMGWPDTFKISTADGRLCATRLDLSSSWDMNLQLACRQGGAPHDVKAVVVYMGSSNDNRKCMTAPVESCPGDAGNQAKRVNRDHWRAKDTFDITVEGPSAANTKTVCARRLDESHGWGMGLQIVCEEILPSKTAAPTEVVLVRVGNSDENKKCVTVKGVDSCPQDAGDQGKRVNRDHFHARDRFEVSLELPPGANQGNIICARRLDIPWIGWGMGLQLYCKQASGSSSEAVVLTIGSSPANKKCVTALSGVVCDRDAGDQGKRANHDHWHANDAFEITAEGTAFEGLMLKMHLYFEQAVQEPMRNVGLSEDVVLDWYFPKDPGAITSAGGLRTAVNSLQKLCEGDAEQAFNDMVATVNLTPLCAFDNAATVMAELNGAVRERTHYLRQQIEHVLSWLDPFKGQDLSKEQVKRFLEAGEPPGLREIVGVYGKTDFFKYLKGWKAGGPFLKLMAKLQGIVASQDTAVSVMSKELVKLQEELEETLRLSRLAKEKLQNTTVAMAAEEETKQLLEQRAQELQEQQAKLQDRAKDLQSREEEAKKAWETAKKGLVAAHEKATSLLEAMNGNEGQMVDMDGLRARSLEDQREVLALERALAAAKKAQEAARKRVAGATRGHWNQGKGQVALTPGGKAVLMAT